MNNIQLRQTIHKKIDCLSEQQLNQVLQFIQQVDNGKQTQSIQKYQNTDSRDYSSTSVNDDWSDFIGSIEAEPDLSSNYKNYLSQELADKYDYQNLLQ